MSNHHRDYLSAMGIEVWQQRGASAAPLAPVARPPVQPPPRASVPPLPARPASPVPVAASPVPVAASPAPVAASPASVATSPVPVAASPTPLAAPAAQLAHTPTWEELSRQVAGCRACSLQEGRSNVVFGIGNRKARLLVIGEAPGAEEDRLGEPFVGRAGQLLNAMLHAIGLKRHQVYIANLLKCRPPGNRDPHRDEVACCRPYLLHQIELIAPELILVLGRVAAHGLLERDDPLAKLRGQEFRFGPQQTPLLVSYHPAYLLRSPQEKVKSWDDLQRASRRLGRSAG